MSISPIPEASIGLLILQVTVLLIINIAGFVGNLLVCIASYRNQRLRSAANIYIIALAITDILASVITTPMTLGSIMMRRWVFGETGCKIQGFFTHFLIYTSMYTLALTAINRYFRIVKPQYYKRFFGGRKPLFLIASVWLFVALFAAIPPLASWAQFAFEPGVSLYMCILDFNDQIGGVVFLLLVLILFVLLSLVLIIGCYVQVSRAIQQHKHNVQLTLKMLPTRKRLPNVSVEEIKITRTLFVLVMAFVVCWIPVYSVVAIIRTGLDTTMTNSGSLIASYLIFLSSAVNPYIYAFNHRTFRIEFKKIIFCNRAVISTERTQLRTFFVNSAYMGNKDARLGSLFERTAQPHLLNVPNGERGSNVGLGSLLGSTAQNGTSLTIAVQASNSNVPKESPKNGKITTGTVSNTLDANLQNNDPPCITDKNVRFELSESSKTKGSLFTTSSQPFDSKSPCTSRDNNSDGPTLSRAHWTQVTNNLSKDSIPRKSHLKKVVQEIRRKQSVGALGT